MPAIDDLSLTWRSLLEPAAAPHSIKAIARVPPIWACVPFEFIRGCTCRPIAPYFAAQCGRDVIPKKSCRRRSLLGQRRLLSNGWGRARAATLASGLVRGLKPARKLFMREHKMVFRVLASPQNVYYNFLMWRERFVSLCHDVNVQRLTF